MIKREITEALTRLSEKFPVIFLTGPRQSGKTTLLKDTFRHHKYVNLEEPDIREFAEKDPRRFLETNNNKIIIDEAQRVPDLFSYIQNIVDENNISGQFILSGSQNFLISEKISQSLAGRTAVLKLLPFSYNELKKTNTSIKNLNEYLFYGFYPRIYDKQIHPSDFYPNYIQTYVERDVRQMKQIGNLNEFIRFAKLCAGRIGQLLNYSSLANDCGISVPTAKSWISVLEASYIIFLLQPHYKNYNKRLVKMPKIYFHDTGLASYLLNISNETQLENHYLRGGLFESFILSEANKFYYSKGKQSPIYFWRDNKGKEIDCIIETDDKHIPLEIKSGSTFSFEYFNGINYWNKLSGNKAEHSFVIYAGDPQTTKYGKIETWRNVHDLLNEI